jgi:hypothetical protein
VFTTSSIGGGWGMSITRSIRPIASMWGNYSRVLREQHLGAERVEPEEDSGVELPEKARMRRKD